MNMFHCRKVAAPSESHRCEDPQPWFRPDEQRPTGLKFESLNIPTFDGTPKFAGVVRNVFSRSECEQIIAYSEDIGYEEALVNVGMGKQKFLPEVRKGWRCIVDSQVQTNEIWERVKALVPPLSDVHSMQRAADSGWVISGLNERLRFLKYTPGDYFLPHLDGTYTSPDGQSASFYTLQLYLNDEFEGGGTRFFCHGDEEINCVPEAGMVLLFEHRIMHEGSLLQDGLKYAIRTDVMATRTPS